MTERLVPSLSTEPPDIEALRVFLLIPELCYFNDVNEIWSLTIPYGNAVLVLPVEAQKILSKYFLIFIIIYFTFNCSLSNKHPRWNKHPPWNLLSKLIRVHPRISVHPQNFAKS